MGYDPATFEAFARDGKLHLYTSRLCAFELAPHPSSTTTSSPTSPPASDINSTPPPPQHTLLFIPGLGDGLLTTPYLLPLHAALPPNWSLIQPLLSSAYNQYGHSSLRSDARDLRACIRYLRRIRPPGSLVVLMGHSTGCQDIMELVVGPLSPESPSRDASQEEEEEEEQEEDRVPIDAAILQAPVSDAEALAEFFPADHISDAIARAEALRDSGRGDEYLPRYHLPSFPSDPVSSSSFSKPAPSLAARFAPDAPLTASRFLDLARQDGGGLDDYFSQVSDLSRTFGRWGAASSAKTAATHKSSPPSSSSSSSSSAPKLLILWGGADEFVRKELKGEKGGAVRTVESWRAAVEKSVAVASAGADDGERDGGEKVVSVESGVVEGATHDLSGSGEAVVMDVVGRVVRFLGWVDADASSSSTSSSGGIVA